MPEISLKTTQRNQLINITNDVQKTVFKSGVKDGICLVYCPHTTAGITINENADPDVGEDLLMGLNKIVDPGWDYRHSEGNSDAHIKSSIIGCEKTIVVENGKLKLGTWQGIMFCEFDGPRNRRVEVKVVKSNA